MSSSPHVTETAGDTAPTGSSTPATSDTGNVVDASELGAVLSLGDQSLHLTQWRSRRCDGEDSETASSIAASDKSTRGASSLASSTFKRLVGDDDDDPVYQDVYDDVDHDEHYIVDEEDEEGVEDEEESLGHTTVRVVHHLHEHFEDDDVEDEERTPQLGMSRTSRLSSSLSHPRTSQGTRFRAVHWSSSRGVPIAETSNTSKLSTSSRLSSSLSLPSSSISGNTNKSAQDAASSRLRRCRGLVQLGTQSHSSHRNTAAYTMRTSRSALARTGSESLLRSVRCVSGDGEQTSSDTQSVPHSQFGEDWTGQPQTTSAVSSDPTEAKRTKENEAAARNARNTTAARGLFVRELMISSIDLDA